jgi:2-amino-4-hydroxy-6-hydroxymethyldihydropteridine diphosphokinase
MILYLGFGTNLGDRMANLQAAAKALKPVVTLLEVSSVYETEPWGYADQPAFYNQVVKGETKLEPLELLMFLKNLEGELGRKPNFRNGPRLIDLDILLYGDQVIKIPGLTIPAWLSEPLCWRPWRNWLVNFTIRSVVCPFANC